MTKFDKEYLELCKKILDEGVEVKNRTGINTLKIPSYNFEFDINKEFPILQSKQTAFKSAIIEMLWIWQMQSNDVSLLHDRGVHIWDKWMVDDDGIYRIYANEETEAYDPNRFVYVMDPLSVPVDGINGFLKPKNDGNGNNMFAKSRIDGKNIIGAKYYGKEYANTIGTAYGYIVNRYKHTQNLIKTINEIKKDGKDDRRMVKSLWQDEFLRTAVLPSCVWATEWDVTGDKLNLSVHQRSCDVPLGLPFNVTQYAALLKMIAQVTNLEAGTMNYSIKDAHIYLDQLKGIKLQLERWQKFNKLMEKSRDDLRARYENLELNLNSKYCTINDKERADFTEEYNMIDLIIHNDSPELWLNPNVKDFFKFDNSRELKDTKLKKYKHLGKIDFPLAR